MEVLVKAVIHSRYKSDDGYWSARSRLEDKGWVFIEEISCVCQDCVKDSSHDYAIYKKEIYGTN